MRDCSDRLADMSPPPADEASERLRKAITKANALVRAELDWLQQSTHGKGSLGYMPWAPFSFVYMAARVFSTEKRRGSFCFAVGPAVRTVRPARPSSMLHG